MAYICSAGLGIPENEISQQTVKMLVQEIFPNRQEELERLLPVFNNAEVHTRQLVVNHDWFKTKHTFKERNDLYVHYSLKHSIEAIDHCLSNEQFLENPIPYEGIDMIMFISSTGISTPSIDAYLLNKRPFREDIIRMPLWGLGCAGGAMGLSRAFDYVTAHPKQTALIICCELCSLTFQKDDIKTSNIIGTALFGDGISAVLLVGEESPYLSFRKKIVPRIISAASFTKKNSTSIMGWDINNDGFEVIFSKQIPDLVKDLWKDHMRSFMKERGMSEDNIHSFIAHPGGKKVLEAMEETLAIPKEKLKNSYKILRDHGNMSSATVFYVLKEWLKENVLQNEQSILCALGPGFSSEILLLEWV